MDSFGTNELRRLMGEQAEPCVSVYLSTHVSGADGQQDPVRLKNLLHQVEDQLAAAWMRAPEARDLLEPARDLAKQTQFWHDRSHGLAMFLAPGTFAAYRLPLSFDELAIVNRRFHLKPLLPMLSSNRRFAILALSQNQVRVWRASTYAIEELVVPNLPANMAEALHYSGADRGSQVHSATNVRLGKEAAVFHGQGGQPETRKEDLAQYFRLVDAAVFPVLREHADPVLLAGVGYLLPIYRQVTRLANLSSQELLGNCDYLTAYQLHQRALPLMEPEFRRQQEEAAAKYRQLAGSPKVSDSIRTIVPAAHDGKIETLFVDLHARQWGLYSPATSRVVLHDHPYRGDEDLLNLAAIETLAHRGAVYTIDRQEAPSGTHAAAVLRYR